MDESKRRKDQKNKKSKRFKSDKIVPNAFSAVQISSREILDKMRKVQNEMISQDER